MQHNIDLLDLLNKAKEKLRIPEGHPVYQISKEDTESLVVGKGIILDGETGPYFSLFSLIDKSNGFRYPLFYVPAHFQKEKGQTVLLRGQGFLIYNPFAIEVLHTINVDAKHIGREDDPLSYRLSLESAIAITDKEGRFRIDPILSFHGESEILYATSYEDLKSLLNPTNRGIRLQGLFAKVQEQEDTATTKENNLDVLHQEYDRLIRRLEEKGSCKITYVDAPNLVSLVKYSLLKLSRQEKNIAIIVNDTDRKIIQPYLEGPILSPLVFDLSTLPLGGKLPTEFTLKNRSSYSCKKAEEFEKNRSAYAKFEEERQATFCLLEEAFMQIPQPLLSQALSKNLATVKMDLSDYGKEDLQRDVDFLKNITKTESLLKLRPKNSVFLGLTSNGSQESYDKLVFLLDRLTRRISAFQERLQNENLRSFSGEAIDNFKSFEEFGKSVRLLGGYNGFPKKYFAIARDEAELKSLKELYQSTSSSHLLLQSLLDDDFEKVDIEKLTRDFRSRSLFRRAKARKLLLSHCRNRNSAAQLDLLATLVSAYQASRSELEAKTNSYAKIYGETVRTMNGVIELETNIAYVKAFHRREEKDPGFSLQSPLVKKCLKDKAFYIDLLKKYQEDEALYFEIRADVNRYIGYFLDDRKNYIEMPFSMLLDLFEEKKKGSYEAFHDFHLFHSQEENASLPFRLCLRRAVLSGHTLEECVSLLILSLFESLYQREKTSWLSKKGDYEEVKKNFIDDIESHGVYLNERLRLSFERTKEHIFSTPAFQDSYQSLSVRYRNNEQSDYVEMIDVLSRIRPVFLCGLDDLKKIRKDTFDIVLLFNSSHLDDMQLVKAMLAGKKVFLLDRNSSTDSRTLGYKETRLDKSTLYYSHYAKEIDPQIFARFSRLFDSLGYVLEKGNDFPLIIRENKPGGKQYALLINLLVPEGEGKESSVDLRQYLYLTYGIRLIDIDIVAFLMDPETTLKKALGNK